MTIDVGAVILAAGSEVFDPSKLANYDYLDLPNVVTSLEFERILSASGPYSGRLMRPYDREEPQKIAWLQCIGSRDLNQADTPYCSSVCCMYAIKEAVIAKEHAHSALDAAVFFMDIRTHGKDFERYYARARDLGVRFIRSRIHSIIPGKDGNLELGYVNSDGEPRTEIFNMVVLSVGLQAPKEMAELAKRLGIELGQNRFVKTGSSSKPRRSQQAAAAQVSAADLQNAKLSEQAALATAYFDLRAADLLKALLDRTVVAYKKTLTITQNQDKVGVVSKADVITAETQVLQTEAQAINVGVERAQYEHSIAVLIGRPPADLSLGEAKLAKYPPRIPVTVPSQLLERRPDIAAAERQMQEENALIGVAVANFYPTINLTGAFGFAGTTPLPISAAAEAWSIAGSATQTIFDGGLLAADLAAARATYAQNVASYRQTVLDRLRAGRR